MGQASAFSPQSDAVLWPHAKKPNHAEDSERREVLKQHVRAAYEDGVHDGIGMLLVVGSI